MDKNSDGSKQPVPVSSLLITIIMDVIIFALWWFRFENAEDSELLKEIPSMIGSLVALSALILGTTVVRSSTFLSKNKGTKFYPKKYGEKKLNSILSELEKNYPEDFTEITMVVKELQYNQHRIETNEYFYYVFILQESDWNFLKVWNDFNYYAPQRSELGKRAKYYLRLEKYIYKRVYDLYIQIKAAK